MSAADWGDLEPYFEAAIVFVELPEAGRAALPSARLAVSIQHEGGNQRGIEITAAEAALLEGIE